MTQSGDQTPDSILSRKSYATLPATHRSAWADNFLAVAKGTFYISFPLLAGWPIYDYYDKGKDSLVIKIVMQDKIQPASKVIIQSAPPVQPAPVISGMTNEEWDTLIDYINEGDSITNAEIEKQNLKTDHIIDYLFYPPYYPEEVRPPIEWQAKIKPDQP